MEKLVKELNLKLDWELDDVYAFNNNTLCVQFINPHKGTNFQYVVRAEYKEDFDKWGNCSYEAYFSDLEKDLNSVISELKEMMLNQ